jgi:hypothetical protein
MDTVPRLIEYIENYEKTLREYEENGHNTHPIYKKIEKCRDNTKRIYDRIMERKTTWASFGKATGENKDCCTTQGDDVYMEIVNSNGLFMNEKKENPHYFKFYDDMNITDKMKKENHSRFLKCAKSNKTVKERYTDKNGSSYYIYKTIPVEIEKYKGKFEVPGKAKEGKSKRSLDDLFQGEANEDSNSKLKSKFKSNIDTSKYVPPSFRNGGNNAELEDRNRKLIIRNISRDMMEDDIADVISTCGKLYDVRIHRDKFTGDSKGFAFVKCETHEIAKKIIETYDKKAIGHMIMRIDFAEDRNNIKRNR